ncbi:MAG: DUF302 domain-containing protein [Campylobacterota bacterium]|nr:DUF302 domain-containing protein [Campylobacterota bacterium]
MKNLLLGFATVTSMFLFLGCENKKGTFLETVHSQNTHEKSVLKLQNMIKDQGLTLFDTIDHQANATTVKLDLKPTTVVVFGNPKMGTVLMNCNPTMGLELPLRILISTDYEGITTFTYTNPEYWSLKHNIKDKNCLNILQKAKVALADLTEKSSLK